MKNNIAEELKNSTVKFNYFIDSEGTYQFELGWHYDFLQSSLLEVIMDKYEVAYEIQAETTIKGNRIKINGGVKTF